MKRIVRLEGKEIGDALCEYVGRKCGVTGDVKGDCCVSSGPNFLVAEVTWEDPRDAPAPPLACTPNT